VVPSLHIEVDDPQREDVRRLLGRHLAFANESSPPEHVHALDMAALLHPSITFFSARRDEELVGVGALKELDPGHGELKSMHIAEAARGRGVGRAIVDHLVDVARRRGYRQVSIETGTTDVFVPARSLYLSAGFTPCDPFGEYTSNPHSICMMLALAR
jgi:putative acetyltransferase